MMQDREVSAVSTELDVSVTVNVKSCGKQCDGEQITRPMKVNIFILEDTVIV